MKTMHMLLNSIRPHFRPLLALFALALAILLPTFLQGGALGHPISDMPDHYWGSWFFGEELLGGRWPIHSEITHLPEGGTLWIVDPIGGFLLLFLRPLGFPVAWNTGLFLQITAACWAGYWLGWTQLKAQKPAFLVGMACGLSPFALGILHSGLSEYAGGCWPPLFIGTLLLAFQRKQGGFWPGLLLFFASLQALPLGLFGWLLALCFLPGPNGISRLKVFFKMSVVWAFLTLPLALFVRSTLQADDALIHAANAPAWQGQTLPVTDLMSWFRPGDWVFPPTPQMGNPGILHINSFGILLLCLAILGWVRSKPLRPLRWGTALFGTLCLGPRLSWGGHITSILLPMALLYFLPFSVFDTIHHPYRMAAFLTPLVALWAAAGLSSLSNRLQIALPAFLLLEWILFSPVPWPLESTPLPDVGLHEQAPPGAILDFPPDLTQGNRTYLMGQVQHGHPIAYGINRFLSPQLKRNELVGRLLRCMAHPQTLARNRDIFPKEPVIVAPLIDGPTLRELGFNSLVVHKQALQSSENDCVNDILSQKALFGQENPRHALWLTR